ncbi:MAG: endonuclease domain-containing protein [Planctomycetaceae bacterium]|nr:endonuclease domain-containing protein [Planctomycetaceae bacterium]
MPERRYASKHMVRRARDQRQANTPPEQLLWLALRNGQIGGLKFRRQHPVGPFVVDFYCHSVGLVVEVDGMSHGDKAAQDAAKTKHLESQGLRILRVTNEDVMRDLDAVTREIARLCGVPWD